MTTATPCLMIGHGGHHDTTSALVTPMASVMKVDLYIRNGMFGVHLAAAEAEDIVRRSHVVIVGLSDYSASTGRAAESERSVLEIAAHAGIPCLLVLNKAWHIELVPYLKHPKIVVGIKLVILDDTVPEYLDAAMLRRFPNATVMRYAPDIAAEIATRAKGLADEYVASIASASAAVND